MKHKILFVTLFLGMILTSSVAAQQWKAVVIKASSFKDDGSGSLIIKLTSGTTIRVPNEYWSSSWSEAVDKAIRDQKLEKVARSSVEPPSNIAAAPMIRSKCANDWPDNFRMRKYCEDQQNESLRALRARQMTGILAKIRSKCANDWPDNFRKRNYCENQQIEALRKLNQ